MTDDGKQAIDFLVYCYFKNEDSLTEAAIDRAYVDMASHTLHIKDSKKWEYRCDASKKIERALKNIDDDFDRWHKNLCADLMDTYGEEQLTYGQAQKWVNMTTKYLYVLYQLFSEFGDESKNDIPEFFGKTDSVEKLHIPLDSIILKEYLPGEKYTWSKMTQKDYEECTKKLKDKGKTLRDEMTDWIKTAKTIRPEKGSYKAWLQDKKKKKK